MVEKKSLYYLAKRCDNIDFDDIFNNSLMPTFKNSRIDKYVDGLDFVDDARFRYIKVSKKVYSSLRCLPIFFFNITSEFVDLKFKKRLIPTSNAEGQFLVIKPVNNGANEITLTIGDDTVKTKGMLFYSLKNYNDYVNTKLGKLYVSSDKEFKAFILSYID